MRIAGGFTNLSFSFSSEEFEIFAGSEPEALHRNLTEDSLEREDWTEIGLPERVQLLFERADEDEVLLILLPGWGKV